MLDRNVRRGCLTDGQLRSMLDATAQETSDGHISSCVRCQQRLAELRVTLDVVRVGLTTIDRQPVVDTAGSYERMRWRMDSGAQIEYQKSVEGSWMSSLFARPLVRVSSAVAVVIVMFAALAVSPMRTVADDFFNQFRVQKFAAVTIPMDIIEPMNSGLLQTLTGSDMDALKQEFDQLGTFDTTFSMDDLPESGTVDDARATFGEFAVPGDLPDGFDGEPNAYVTDAGTASYTLNVDRARDIIDGLNLPIYALDNIQSETIDFQANIPAAVLLEYQNDDGERIVVAQMDSPQISFPDELDMDALREEILRFPGLPTDFVAQLRGIDDWENTLIIPIPEGAESDDVTINGEPGLLIEHALFAAVLWEDGGTLHAVIGQVDGDTVEDIADSMD